MEGSGHEPLDFHAPTKTPSNPQVPVTKKLETVIRKKRLIDMRGFEKMTICNWHIQMLPAKFHLELGEFVLSSNIIW